ncbi:MAG: FkbM family methyltransferase [Xenococcaceae cyanobacterium MO_188.B32]|nr:FkbM family methyltransferase [Xenococcaceae cyanobacterium MO_188.B32]
MKKQIKAALTPVLMNFGQQVLKNKVSTEQTASSHLIEIEGKSIYLPKKSLFKFNYEHIFSHLTTSIDTPVNFIQIGSFDGITNDPIRKFVINHSWKGIFVEPIKEYYDRLLKNYDGIEGLIFKNVAIDSKPGHRSIYRLRPEAISLTPYAPQFSTFNREVLTKRKNKFPEIESLIEEVNVPCMTVQEIINTEGMTRVDLVQIDTEGYDFEILKSIDLQLIKPSVIRYEHIHLKDEDRQKSVDLLVNNGYKILFERMDITAYKL